MYAIIEHTSYNAKELEFRIKYNDVFFYVSEIRIDGIDYDIENKHPERMASLINYLRSRINVWQAIRQHEAETAIY